MDPTSRSGWHHYRVTCANCGFTKVFSAPPETDMAAITAVAIQMHAGRVPWQPDEPLDRDCRIPHDLQLTPALTVLTDGNR